MVNENEFPEDDLIEPIESKESIGFVLGQKLYDRMKLFVQIILPAFATFYLTLGNIWGFGYVEQVVATTTALTTFFGAILGLSSRTYNNSNLKYSGVVKVTETADKLSYKWVLDGDPADPAAIADKDEVTFKVFKQ